MLKSLHELAVLSTQKFDLPKNLNVKLINLSENATYKIEAPDGQRWAMRVHREDYHSKKAIASELAWLMALRQQKVCITPKPVPGYDGKLIQEVSHPSLKGSRQVVVFDWEEGVEPSIVENLSEQFENLGEIAARMHIHARSWQRPDYFTRFIWNFETSLGEEKPHWGRWRDGLGVDARKAKLLGRTVATIENRLAAYGKPSERFGLIHGDLRLSNLLINGPTVKVIDFDDCGFGWNMYDAATPVSFYEHDPQVPALIDAWKTGYRKAGILSREDEQEIPTFIMLRRLLLVAWIGSHAETDLAKSMGLPYTEGTSALCESYLSTVA